MCRHPISRGSFHSHFGNDPNIEILLQSISNLYVLCQLFVARETKMMIKNSYAIQFGYSYITNLNSVCVSSISCLSSIYCSSDVGIHYYSQCSNHVCREMIINLELSIMPRFQSWWIQINLGLYATSTRRRITCHVWLLRFTIVQRECRSPFYNLLEQENSKEESSSRTNVKANSMGVGN